MLRVFKSRWIALAIVPLLLASAPMVAQEAKKSEKAAKPAKRTRTYRGRLPNGWTQLKLTDEQKKKIYAHQLEARPKIVKLQRELAELRAALREKMLEVLTEEQRQQVAKMESERRQRGPRRRGAEKSDARKKRKRAGAESTK